MKTSLKFLVTLAICATAGTAGAAVIVNESFQNYSAGTLADNTTAVNATGLTGNIQIAGNTSNVASIEAGTMSFSNGSLSLNGGNQFLRIAAANTSATGVNLGFSSSLAPSGGSVYMSFLYRFNGTANSGDIGQGGFQSNLDTGLNVANNVATQSYGTAFRTNIGGVNNSVTSALTAGNVNLLVVQYISSGTQWTGANVWINPDSTTEGTATYTVTGGSNGTSWVALASTVSLLESGDSVDFDRYMIGTTWSDVVVPEPGTFAMLLGGIGMLALFRRRANS
jgi:hypothetical protein